MKLLGRSGSAEPGGEVRRVTGRPGATAGGPDGGPPTHGGAGSTPVQSRLARLASAVGGTRRGRSDRNVRKILQVLGMVAIAMGFVCIILGWYGSSHSPYLYEEIPYLISGGLLGVGLVFGGGILIHSAWSLRKIEEDRRNALAIVRSVDRLERILRESMNGRAESRIEHHEEVR